MRIRRFVTIGMLVAVGSCSDSTSPTSDVDALVDQMSGNGIASYSTAALAASGVTTTPVAVPSASSSSCSFTASTQFFDCAPITGGGLTITRSFQLLDASGQALSTMDPAAVVALRTVTSIKGTPTPLAGTNLPTMTIDRHEDATMSDLKSATHVLNGTSTQKVTLALPSGTMTSDESSTTSNLLLPKPTPTVHWPLGGSITTDRTMTFPGVAPQTSQDVISFDGTSVMTVKHTLGTISFPCKIDLSKPPGASPAVCS